MDSRVVAVQKEAAARDDVIGLAGGLPAEELLPRAELARSLAEVTAAREGALQYGWPEGDEALREWIAHQLAARGAIVDPARVIVTAGAQQALAIAAALIARPIAVGDATYAGALDAFRGAGVEVVADGADARYVIAGVSNPQGFAMPEVAAETLIVDEAYALLRFDGVVPPPRVGDRVWHVGTVSKTIAPGLRVGWLVPPAAHHDAALERKHAADLQTASLSQAALARLVATLDHDALIARARARYAERAVALTVALRRHAPGLTFRDPEGGLSLWIETGEPGDELALLDAALAEGVMFDPGGGFRPAPRREVAFRLSYSNVAPARLDDAARRVAKALDRWRRAR